MLLHPTYLVKAHFCVFFHFVSAVSAVVKAVNQAVVHTEQQHQPIAKQILILLVA